jgi:hypothetical protein
MLKAGSDLGAHIAARPKQRPWPIQAVGDRVFRPKRRITLTTVDALTDLSALQRDIIIDKTLHGLIVPQQQRAVVCCAATLSTKTAFQEWCEQYPGKDLNRVSAAQGDGSETPP